MKEKNRQKLFVKCAILLLKRVIRRGLQTMESKEEKLNPIYPEGLKAGDQVCIIVPANAFTEKALDAATSHLEARGLNVTVSEDMAFRRGTPKERAEKFNRVIEDPNHRGIFCIWGGYGTIPLLDKINYDALSKNRPVFTGFSDITAMHLAIGQNTGLVTYHGPSFFSTSRQPTETALCNFLDVVASPGKERELKNFNGEAFAVLKEGVCEGRIAGGNMTLVSRLMGTPYEIDARGKILFLEEVGEKPYRLHGMLYQLKLAGKLDEAAGVIIGSLTDCDIEGRPGSAEAMVREVLKDLQIPVVLNVRAGHIKDPLTIPMNGLARIDGARVILSEQI